MKNLGIGFLILIAIAFFFFVYAWPKITDTFTNQPDNPFSVNKESTLFDDMYHLSKYNIIDYHGTDLTYNSVSGSGVTSTSGRVISASTGATPASTAIRYLNGGVELSTGQNYTQLNWNKPIAIIMKFQTGAGTANGKSFIGIGDYSALPLADKGFGIEVDQYDVYGTVHDGTILKNTNLGITLTLNVTYCILAYSDGLGNASWYSCDSQEKLGSSLGAPVGLSPTNKDNIVVSVLNGMDNSNQNITTKFLAVGVEQ